MGNSGFKFSGFLVYIQILFPLDWLHFNIIYSHGNNNKTKS